MTRRSLLKMLGLAPVAALVPKAPAALVPKPEPETVTSGLVYYADDVTPTTWHATTATSTHDDGIYVYDPDTGLITWHGDVNEEAAAAVEEAIKQLDGRFSEPVNDRARQLLKMPI